MITVYVSGPLTQGYQPYNVHMALKITRDLKELGYAPYCPHLNYFVEIVSGYSVDDYEGWMKIDLEWVKRCDTLFRIPGYSPGGDREVALAQSLSKPVFLTWDEAREYMENLKHRQPV